MDDILNNSISEPTDHAPTPPATKSEDAVASAKEKAHVNAILKKIGKDKKHHEKAFERMRRDMHVATHGAEDDWHKDNYVANIAGRHVKQKTAALYAKNPKAQARRRETLDFVLWDENPQSMQVALHTVSAAAMMASQAAAAGPTIDPVTGMAKDPVPQMPPGFEQAQALLQDIQQGMQRRQEINKVCRTLEVLLAQAMRQQQPVDFETAMKQVVRRACTTGVGYVEVAFERQTGPQPGLNERLADSRVRLNHLQRLTEEAAEGDITDTDAEMDELERSIAALQSEPDIIVRENLLFDYPRSTKVIPDAATKTLVGFQGARHLSLEYDFTCDEVEEFFGVDLKQGSYKPYTSDGKAPTDETSECFVRDDNETGSNKPTGAGMVRVWKHFDKPSGLVYYVADGHDSFLREPSSPEVFVETFFPVYALTFNEVENETELFPPSDVTLMLNMVREYNRARQGQREHREAARPRWAYANGAIDEEDVEKLQNARAFQSIGVNMDPNSDLSKVLKPIPVPGVDPNLYETSQLFTDMQLVVGTQEAMMGGTSKSTATEAAIAQGSSASSDTSAIDDLDAFLTVITRAAGQILLKEMSEETVKKAVGPGAVWPQMTLEDIANEVFLEIEAGSTGKPNQAAEIQKWQQLLPYLIQMGGISQVWLARETLRRLDDRMDLTEAIAEGTLSTVAQNAMATGGGAAVQPGTGKPGSDPAAQGAQGANNGPAPPGGPSGTSAAFGSNQV